MQVRDATRVVDLKWPNIRQQNVLMKLTQFFFIRLNGSDKFSSRNRRSNEFDSKMLKSTKLSYNLHANNTYYFLNNCL